MPDRCILNRVGVTAIRGMYCTGTGVVAEKPFIAIIMSNVLPNYSRQTGTCVTMNRCWFIYNIVEQTENGEMQGAAWLRSSLGNLVRQG